MHLFFFDGSQLFSPFYFWLLICIIIRNRLISETSLMLLGLTMLASLLHFIFECLAFQSDISFWKENKSLAGLSTRAVVTDLISQFIVFLFLLESEASLLVTLPTAFGLFVQMWKVFFEFFCNFIDFIDFKYYLCG